MNLTEGGDKDLELADKRSSKSIAHDDACEQVAVDSRTIYLD